MRKSSDPRIVVIGGGTGSFMLLNALKHQTSNITALVNMVDNGGSTGLLRDEFGVLPPGDIRQCLVALSKSSEELRRLFTYRYAPGSTFSGHSFGNLFLSTVELMTDDFAKAVELASRVLQITGKVVPVTLTNCTLVLEEGGNVIKGEQQVERHAFNPRSSAVDLRLEPEATVNPQALEALHAADVVVIAPGNLYASLLPSLVVPGVREALVTSPAKVVYVCNLVNKIHQTKNFAVHDYVHELERYLGPGAIDGVLYSIDTPPAGLVKKYADNGESLVIVDSDALSNANYQAYGGHFLSAPVPAMPHDTLIKRSLIRHDAQAVVSALLHNFAP